MSKVRNILTGNMSSFNKADYYMVIISVNPNRCGVYVPLQLCHSLCSNVVAYAFWNCICVALCSVLGESYAGMWELYLHSLLYCCREYGRNVVFINA